MEFPYHSSPAQCSYVFSTLEFIKNRGNHHLGLPIWSLLWPFADATGISEYAQFFSMCPPSLLGWKPHQFAHESQATSTATNTGFLSKCLMLSLSLLRISELKGKQVFNFKRCYFLAAPSHPAVPLCWHSEWTCSACSWACLKSLWLLLSAAGTGTKFGKCQFPRGKLPIHLQGFLKHYC